jgi:hypothetical protein
MLENQQLLNQLKDMLHWKKSKNYYAKALGISVFEVDQLLQQLSTKAKPQTISTKTIKVDAEKGTLESTVVCDYEPKNDKQLASLHKIDLNNYVITNYWSKLLPNGKFTSSVFSKRKQAKDYTAEDFSKFLENYKPKTITVSPVDHSKEKDHVDIEISISDYHLAKRHIDDDNNPVERAYRYFNVAQSLIKKVVSVYNVNTLVFPISNDFFHTDNYQNQTTQGTPQDTILDYSSEYELGFSILVDTINMLRFYSSEVHVILVQGNHDRTKSFYLAHALEVHFKRQLDVTFDREHSVVKGKTLGDTFIGWHHGNCKVEDLPLLFATHPEHSKAFGNAKYREVHTGDKHHYMAKEVKGVRIQQMPSLSGTDRWHLDNNYVHSVRAALVLVYDKHKGKIAEFEERI